MSLRGFASYLGGLLIGGIAGLMVMFLAFERLGMPGHAHVWRAYHDVILDYVPGPRVLIESGSNTLHSIRTDILEQTLNLPTFVIADNASVPLTLRMKRLEKYAKDGDVIVLPLEWEYYKVQAVPADFLSLLSSRWSGYYFLMPTLERFEFFVRYLSLDFIVSEIWSDVHRSAQDNAAAAFANLVDERLHWAGVTDQSEENRIPHSVMKGTTCSSFLGIPHGINDFVYDFANALVDLRNRRHVTVVITWPAVAGSDCYADPDFQHNVDALRNVFVSRGIPVVGKPEDAAFSASHMLDFYYHIDIEAAAVRSARLADALNSLGIARNQLVKSSQSLTDAALAREAARVLVANGKLETSRISNGDYHVGNGEFEKRFVLMTGWSAVEPWGVWNSEAESTLVLLPQPDKDCALTFQARYFSDGPPSKIQIDDQDIDRDSKDEITIPHGTAPVTVTLLHQQLRSPRDLGLGDDPRKLAFGLENVHVRCGDVAPVKQ